MSELIKVKGIKTEIIFDTDDKDLASITIQRRSELLLGLSNIIENSHTFEKKKNVTNSSKLPPLVS